MRGLEFAISEYVPAEGNKPFAHCWGFKRSEVECRIPIRAHQIRTVVRFGCIETGARFQASVFSDGGRRLPVPTNDHEVSTLLLRRGFQVGGVRIGILCNRFFPVQLCLSLSLGGKTYVRLLFAWHQEPARQ